MKSETRICRNCKKEFRIEPEDFAFYEKIKVPPPTWCSECRRQRRLSWRNDFIFYSRTCDLCKKRIISLYSTDKPMPVYCNKCWWSDRWDPKEYAKDFDFSRPFFEQFRELQNLVPVLALVNDDGVASINCEYTHDFAFGKNCYMVFIAWRVEDCLYSWMLNQGKSLVDVMSVFASAQYIYDSIFVGTSHSCRNIYYSYSLNDCSFCYDCRGCSNCFLSIGLRNKKYCYKNKQYSKEKYEEILASYQLDTYSGAQRAWEEFRLLILQYPRRFAHLKQCVNVIGDDLENCKNVKYGFNVGGAEDCAFIENADSPKDGYDNTVGGEYNQCYESLTPDQSYRDLFTMYSWKNTDITYCDSCHSSKYLFGCAGLKKAQYCILNKQYTKESFDNLRAKIIEHMKQTGEWGEFFPSNLSHFGYNETLAQEYYPITREEASTRGFKWQDHLQFTMGQETIRLSDIPDSIRDVSDSILKEVLACMTCQRNYRIIPAELEFYRLMKIPVPRRCFYCRSRAQLAFRNPFRLWHRKCTCAGEKSDNEVYQNQANHFHGTSHCPNEFETSYAPERPEIVYCGACYQSEVV